MIIDVFLPYIILYALALIMGTASLFMPNNGRWQKVLFQVGFVLLLIMVGMRDRTVGSDTLNYLASFHHPEMGYGENGDTDPGFQLYLYLTHYLLFDQGTLFLMLTAIIGLGGMYYMISHISHQPVLSLMIFVTYGTNTIFLYHYMSAVRQSIAEGLFMIAITLYLGQMQAVATQPDGPTSTVSDGDGDEASGEGLAQGVLANQDKVLAMVLMAIAIFVHGATLAMVPVILLAPRMHTSRWVWALIIVGTYFLGVQSFISIKDIIFAVFNLFGPASESYLAKYLMYFDFGHGEVDMTLINPGTWPFSVLALLVIWCCDRQWIKSPWVILFLMSVVLNNLFSDNIIWSRVFLYISLLAIVVLPNLIERRKSWLLRGILMMLTCYFVMRDFKLLLAMWVEPDGNVVIPYMFTTFDI